MVEGDLFGFFGGDRNLIEGKVRPLGVYPREVKQGQMDQMMEGNQREGKLLGVQARKMEKLREAILLYFLN